jgi:amino acid transporter
MINMMFMIVLVIVILLIVMMIMMMIMSMPVTVTVPMAMPVIKQRVGVEHYFIDKENECIAREYENKRQRKSVLLTVSVTQSWVGECAMSLIMIVIMVFVFLNPLLIFLDDFGQYVHEGNCQEETTAERVGQAHESRIFTATLDFCRQNTRNEGDNKNYEDE